jgi:hypothetical protein
MGDHYHELDEVDSHHQTYVELWIFCVSFHVIVVLFGSVDAKKTDYGHSADRQEVVGGNTPDILQEKC